MVEIKLVLLYSSYILLAALYTLINSNSRYFLVTLKKNFQIFGLKSKSKKFCKDTSFRLLNFFPSGDTRLKHFFVYIIKIYLFVEKKGLETFQDLSRIDRLYSRSILAHFFYFDTPRNEPWPYDNISHQLLNRKVLWGYQRKFSQSIL